MPASAKGSIFSVRIDTGESPARTWCNVSPGTQTARFGGTTQNP